MTTLQVLLLSITEGLTEFLPVSSTGHLILATQALGILQNDFVKSFEIFIQLGAILAVILIYFKYLLANKHLWVKIAAAFVPTGVIGLILYKFVKTYLIGNVSVTVISLFLGGLVLLVFEKFIIQRISQSKSIETLTLLECVVIGTVQALSVIPGVSRAAATIVGGLVVGLDRQDSVKFSFLLAIPTMVAAVGLDLIKSGVGFTSGEFSLLALGFVGAFVTAFVVVKFFLKFIQTHTFVPFAIYRILFALFYVAVFIRK